MNIWRGIYPPPEWDTYCRLAAVFGLLYLVVVAFCGWHIPLAFSSAYGGPRKGGAADAILATCLGALGVFAFWILPHILPRRPWAQVLLAISTILFGLPLMASLVGVPLVLLALIRLLSKPVSDYFQPNC